MYYSPNDIKRLIDKNNLDKASKFIEFILGYRLLDVDFIDGEICNDNLLVKYRFNYNNVIFYIDVYINKSSKYFPMVDGVGLRFDKAKIIDKEDAYNYQNIISAFTIYSNTIETYFNNFYKAGML